MKKALNKKEAILYHKVDGSRIKGANKNMTNNTLTLWGDCSGLWGDLNKCEITHEERKQGVDLKDLIL